MNNELDLLFLVLSVCGIVILIGYLIYSSFKECKSNAECCKNCGCKKNSMRNWGIFIFVIVLIWQAFRGSPDIYVRIASWAIMLSLIVSAAACVVLSVEVVSLLNEESITDKKDILKDQLMIYLLAYFSVFILFIVAAIMDKQIMTHLNELSFLKKRNMKVDFSLYKVTYSLIYLWAYVLMTSRYITILKRKRENRAKKLLSITNIQHTIDELKEILHRIDLPLAFSFLFFFIIFVLIRNSNYKEVLDYFGYGGSSLHIFTSTGIFLYGYGEEYFDLNFIKFHRD